MREMAVRSAFSVLCLLLVAHFAFGAEGKTTKDSNLTLVDRTVAVVDEDPILASDIERAIGLELVERKPNESDDTLRRRVLDELIEQRLRSHEIDELGTPQVAVQEVERQIATIRSHFPDEASFAARLAEFGTDLAALRQVVARQLAVLAYIDDRLGARVFVGLDEIRAYFQDSLVPELTRRGEAPPPLEDVREEIRTLLREKKLNEEIERWSERLRRDADIEIYWDERFDALPRPPVPLDSEKP